MAPPHTILLFFFFNDTATTEIYTLSLHDALPISDNLGNRDRRHAGRGRVVRPARHYRQAAFSGTCADRRRAHSRSEEHTSELQSHLNLVCRLLLEKKKKQKQSHYHSKLRSHAHQV